MPRFKLKKANGPTRTTLAIFDVQPSWEDLASNITALFKIPSSRVGLVFVNEAKATFTITDEQELQYFYKSLNQSSEVIKFVVQDLESPDPEHIITSTWSNPSDLSQSNDEFRLFCSVLTKSDRLFSVKIKKSETVDDVKKAIKKEMEHALVGIDAKMLDIWKLSPPIHSSELDKKLRHAQTPKDIEGCDELLDPFDKLLEHFSSPPDKHVHIIVQLPSIPAEDTEIRRLRLLCERYWNRGENGRAEIYKEWTAQVPFMAKPVNTDGAEGAATTSEEMVTDAKYLAPGAQEAIPVASKTMSAPSGDTSEGSNEELDDASDLDFNNNCTVFYESLSLGPGFDDFFGNGYSSILVRKEYRDMFKHISNLRHKGRGKRGVVITGTPGIGKSFFLYFVLVERILNGQCTAYQCSPTGVILMLGRRDVRVFPADSRLDSRGFPWDAAFGRLRTGTWALVDSTVESVQPRGEFTSTHSKFYLVQATSPEPARWKAWKNQLSAAMAVMKPWSWEELYIGGTEYISPPLDALTLRNVFVKYGRSARHCYTLAKDCAKVAEWEEQIPDLLARMPDISIFEGHIAGNRLHPTAESAIKAASQLIAIIPDPARQPCVTLVSRHIAGHLFRAVLMCNHKRFWNYFNRLSSESHTPAGWLWELHAIRVELSTERTRTISLCRLPPIKPLSKPPNKKIRVTPDAIELPFSDVIVHGNKEALGEALSHAIRSLSPTKSTLFIPDVRNQVTFHAFSISGDNVVTLYQATNRESHSIKAKGLDFVWDALTLAEGTSRLMPSSSRKWRLVFLIPENVETH